MKFKYVEYNQDILKDLKEDFETIYIFSDYFLKNSYKKGLVKNVFRGVPTILTFDEFKQNIFVTDKVILREAKRFISFYNGNKSDLKKLLGMNSYYDSIDFADSFFKYYKELNHSMKPKVSGVQKWQERYINHYEILKENYDRYLKNRNHILLDWIETKDNINLDFVESYKRIVFVDIVDFTPLEKELISKLEEKLEVKLILQIKPEDFDENELSIKSVTLPIMKNNIEVFEVSESMEELINLKTLTQRYPGDIFSVDYKNNRFHKIVPRHFLPPVSSVLNDTMIYRFIKTQYELVSSLEERLGKALPLFSLKNVLETVEYKVAYDIDNETMTELYNLLDQDYKYLPNDSSDKLKKIHQDLISISKFKRIEDFVDYFKQNLDLEKFYEGEYTNLFEKFYEGISLAKTSEYMLGEDGFNGYFSNGSEIYKLIIQYMNNIEIDRVDIEENVKDVVRDFKLSKGPVNKCSYFLDCSSRTLPENIRDNSIFTEHQRRENNLMTKEKNRILQKYRFYQSVLNSQTSKIFYIKNQNSGDDISPFITEILETYKIGISNNPINTEEILSIFEKSLISDPIKNNHEKDDLLPKKIEDFKDGKCTVGAYDYEMLEGCKYRFYLSKICGVEPQVKDWTKSISLKFLGIFIHAVLEEVTDKMWKNIVYKNDFYLAQDFVDEIQFKHLSFNREKIPVYMDNYFKEILVPRFSKNILKFYKELEKAYSGKKILRFESEKIKPGSREPIVDKDIKFYINGRVDFIIETDSGNLVLDFKTGKKQDKQLDFYTILLYGDETAAEKSIYNAFTGDLEKATKIELTKEILKETLTEFLNSDNYSLSSSKSTCRYCDFIEICRREF
ncbi:MAG: PD-(D/E)XK nuclease family protein [Cetobacterium sp.]|uniref:RecB family exonuclease n=1 Tax=Cetobacterium sp. TaxID=2071632 RepID=UPI002FCAADEE